MRFWRSWKFRLLLFFAVVGPGFVGKKAQARFRMGIVHGKTGEEGVAYSDARLCSPRRYFKDHHVAAALVDVVLRGQYFHLRRSKSYGQIQHCFPLPPTEKASPGIVAGRDVDGRTALF